MINVTFLMFALMALIKAQNLTTSTPPASFTTIDSVSTVSATINESSTLTNSEENSEELDKIPLYLSAFFTLGGNWDGSGILPAVEMALDHINDQVDILPGYELRMVWNDTRCDSGLGTKVLFDHIYHKPQKIMILGPACSTAAQAVAETAYHWNLVTMSYSAASSALSNREKYPYFYRTYMPDAAVNPARVRLMKDFGWTRVATIHYNHELFSLAIDDLLTLLREVNITIITSESFAENPKNQVANIKNQDAKIIVSNMYANAARRVFCEAYKLGMTGTDYAWMLIGWYADKWWAVEDDYIDCTVEEMTEAVLSAMYISTEPLQISPKTDPIVSGITPQEYTELLRERMELPENQQYTWNSLSPFGYDAAWAIALMLNRSIEVLQNKVFSDKKKRRLENFTYEDSEMADVFFDLLKETDFSGATGPVSFRDGDRVGVTQVEQLQAGCEMDWHLHNGHCYYLGMEKLSYADAKVSCESQGANLATVSNQNEQDYLDSLLNGLDPNARSSKWFIGLTYNDTALNFTWADPVHSYSYLTWQPTGSMVKRSNRPGDCVYIDYTQQTTGRWLGIRCSEMLSYICQKNGEFSERRIALYTTNGDILEWEKDIIWRDGKIPLDHTPEIIITRIRIHHGIGVYLYMAMCIPAGIGILLALFFLGFNIKFKNQRFVKMSSPSLNNLILLGSIFVYGAVMFAGLDGTLVSEEVQAVACQIRAWVFSVGFVLAFGSMFCKTWRVHKVAAFKTPKRVIITDNQLFAMVFVFFLIDVCILTAWQIFDPLFVEITDLYERDDPAVENQRIIPYIEQCNCNNLIYWLVPLYSYKGLLLLFGTFLAWETRKVTIPALNDSKLIGICVYNVIVLCIVGVSVSFLISNDTSALFIFTSSIIMFCTTLTLGVVFTPKVISVYKYPEGEPVSNVKSQMNTFQSQETMSSGLNEENEKLRAKVKELQTELTTKHSNGTSTSSPGIHERESSSGCGLWCGPMVCGCCSSGNVVQSKPYTVDVDKNGCDNNGIDMDNKV